MNHSRFDHHFLGVLGGMGPLASAVFMKRLTALTAAEVDQQHIPTILWSDPRIPDRTDAMVNGGEDPLPWLMHGASRLKQAGARAIVIPCNSAHLWYDELSEAVRLPILHIVTAVAANLQRLGMLRGRIGLIGTTGTLKLGLYQRQLDALALLSHDIKGFLRFSPVKHHCKGREFMHERMSGNHLSSSKTFTARRCPAVSSGASMTVGRRPGPPVEVRTSVALMPARLSSIFLADTSGASATLARLTSINPRTVANVCSRIDPSAH